MMCTMDIAKPMSLNLQSVIMTYFRGISTTSQHLQCYNVRNECKTISTLRCMTKPKVVFRTRGKMLSQNTQKYLYKIQCIQINYM